MYRLCKYDWLLDLEMGKINGPPFRDVTLAVPVISGNPIMQVITTLLSSALSVKCLRDT